MIVGASIVEIYLHGCHSLKAKRGVVRSIAQRVRNRFNLSIAEVGGQDTWQRAVLGLTTVGSDRVSVRNLLERANEFIEDLHLAEVRNVDVEIVDLPHEEGLWDPEDPADED
ncbi:MAG: DUF503 domain-containing protein [Myxococcales bacterium]|nr:DUF503 domain-containing protein [Myxococcales bacterium]MDH5306085.1 DUF503 domain-containing protein [Myxococcales bacterium]MDH5566072.1 DUF503 domain-containing protein [Myxococcales bacterium]